MNTTLLNLTTKAKGSKLLLGGLAGGALVIALGAVAYATIPGPAGVIHGCFDRAGNLRVIDASSDECRRNETPITWNHTGPQGPAGIIGPEGPAGAQGAVGLVGAPGAMGAMGPAGPAGVNGAPGSTGAQGPAGPAGASGSGGSTAPHDVVGVITIPVSPPDPCTPQIYAFHWGVSNTGSLATGAGGGAGKAQSQAFTFVKALDACSPHLFVSTAEGEHLQSATLELFRPGTTEAYVRYILTDVLIVSDEQGRNIGDPNQLGDPTVIGDPGIQPERVQLSFAKIRQEFPGTDATSVGGWDFQANKKD
jgi:type VI secretion system Hcp family effector